MAGGRRREFWRARGPPRTLPAYRVCNQRVSAARSPRYDKINIYPRLKILLEVVDSGFFLGGCVQGTCRVPHPKGVLSQTPLGWVESFEGGFQSLNRRPWPSSRPLRECREQLLTQDAIRGSGTARHLGPTPRARLKFGRFHVCQTRTSRNRRVRDARRSGTYWNRAVERRFRAQSAGCSF